VEYVVQLHTFHLLSITISDNIKLFTMPSGHAQLTSLHSADNNPVMRIVDPRRDVFIAGNKPQAVNDRQMAGMDSIVCNAHNDP
jgi:hypothetical protein